MADKKITDQERYDLQQAVQAREWEETCRSCGACCGIVEGDPCEFLAAQDSGKFFCRIYENRFGLHKTRAGKEFRCVPLRDIIHKTWPGDMGCAYKKIQTTKHQIPNNSEYQNSKH